MSRLRAPGSVNRSIRPPSGLTRPPQIAPVSGIQQQAPRGPKPSSQPRPPPPVAEPAQGTFQVGDNVLVGGVKPGRIAFLGPTQFAQGIWAGIVLDTPEGKNDGSVKGVSYFTCQPNYGLFAKTDKLTPLPRQQQPHPPVAAQQPHPQPVQDEVNYNIGDRVQVEGGKIGTVAFVGGTQFAKGLWVGVALDTPHGKNNGVVGGVEYFTCAPNHGLFTRPMKLKLATPTSSSVTPTNLPPPVTQPTFDPTELKKKAESLAIGDRVLVNNSKEGTLKFIGQTHFAKGIWVGVELDDAQGKNDGAVSGKRYFQCNPLHGLFAPLPKVEKVATDVASRRLSGRGLSGSPVSSVSSMSSMGRIRQLQQIEAEPLSPAQSDISANGSNSLSHIMFEKDHQIATLKSTLEQTELEKVKLSEEITELRRKVDDLQFLLEEQDIISDDKLEKVTSKEQTELKELKELLAQEKSNHQSTAARLEKALNQQTQSSSSSNNSLELQEHIKDIEKLEKEKEQLLADINKVQTSLKAAENDFKTTETAAKDLQTELESVSQQLQETLDLCSQQESLLEEKVLDIDRLEEDKKQLHRDLERVTKEKESLLSSTEQLIGERDNALTQCNRLRAESSSATSEHSYLAEQCQELMSERDQLKQQLRETKSLLEQVSQERNDALYNLTDLKTQGQEAHGKSQELNSRYESIQKELSEANTELGKARREATVLTEEIEQIKLTGQQKLELVEANCAELKQRLSKANKERELALEEAQAASDKVEEFEQERNILIETSNNYEKMNTELRDQIDYVTQQYNTLASEGHSNDVQAQLEDTEERLELKMRELAEAKERISSLEEEVVILSANGPDEERVLALEEDKIRLEEMVSKLSSQNTTSGGGEDSQAINELKEETRTLHASLQDKDQEITFLNSVIAELQAKVDSLEALNGLGDQAAMLGGEGYSSEEDLLGSQLPPPRVFCDICDEFDLHDTADCPMQAADIMTDSPPPSMHHGIRTNERPYCENCEVFGHWSDECQYEETY